MSGSIRVALIEDQRRTREGLATLIGGSARMDVVGQYDSAEEALREIATKRPDVVLADLGLPGMGGIELIAHLSDLLPGTPILVLTVYGEDKNIFDALCAGACGFLLKDIEPSRLIEAIREVYEGGAPMSPEIARRVVSMFQRFTPPKAEHSGLSVRELEVLTTLSEGDSYKTCADRLAISIDTVRFHVRHIYERLHVHSRTEAVIKALRKGWIH